MMIGFGMNDEHSDNINGTNLLSFHFALYNCDGD
jgi:hypothetical protein